MINILRKELKELSKSKEILLYYIIIVSTLGVVIPISSKESILGGNWYVMGLVFQIIAITLPSNLTADLFAGEKERKTIETLLFSPISVTTIYVGKVLYAILVPLIIIIFSFITSYITIAIMYYQRYNVISFSLYSSIAIYTIVINSLIIVSFAAFLGAFFSLKFKKVREVNLINVFVSMPIIMPLASKLYSARITWSFIFKYELVLIILSISFIVLVNKFFTRQTIMKNS